MRILQAVLIAVLALLAGTAFGLGAIVPGIGFTLAILAALYLSPPPHATDEAERYADAVTPKVEE